MSKNLLIKNCMYTRLKDVGLLSNLLILGHNVYNEQNYGLNKLDISGLHILKFLQLLVGQLLKPVPVSFALWHRSFLYIFGSFSLLFKLDEFGEAPRHYK